MFYNVLLKFLVRCYCPQTNLIVIMRYVPVDNVVAEVGKRKSVLIEKYWAVILRYPNLAL